MDFFGGCSFCGMRKKRPRLVDGTTYLQENDSINCVSGVVEYSKIEVVSQCKGNGNILMNVCYDEPLVHEQEQLKSMSQEKV